LYDGDGFILQPCAVAGMFGCAPMNSTYDYWKNGVPWEGEFCIHSLQVMSDFSLVFLPCISVSLAMSLG
jgi:hypothetical protein